MPDTVPIRSLMSTKIACVDSGTSLVGICRTMCKRGYSCLVVTEAGVPVGIITERDMTRMLMNVLEKPKSSELPASKLMSSPPITIDEGATLFEALVLCRSRAIRHLPIVNAQGVLTGLVTQSDLARAHLHMIETQRDIIEHSVAERTRELEDANEQLKALSLEDALLEIGNRRAMEVDLTYTHETALRYQRPYSVALLDVDCFKLYNDHYGHAAGDGALKNVANFLRTTVRKADRLYRYGGEEILLLLPETEVEGAQVLCQRLVEGLAECGIPHSKSPFEVVTMSVGVSCAGLADPPDDKWQAIVARADRALYRAKDGGRNQVAFAPSLEAA